MSKGPHISIPDEVVVSRILRIHNDDFSAWPASVKELATKIALELFLVIYNPFVNAQNVKKSVETRWKDARPALAHHYATSIGEGITLFWSTYDEQNSFRHALVERLKTVLPHDCILTRKSALVEASTDATDLRMELPLLVVEPATVEQVSELVKIANEMLFALIPRGGASGLTGGTVPARKRTVIVNLTRLTGIKIDTQSKILSCEAGVITQHAIDAVAKENLLFTVDPASKTASTIGGNIAENSGGPCAFEYGTTLDNLLSWTMVTPTGEIIEIHRIDHPKHKILENEIARFEVRDKSGGMRSIIELKGSEIRLPGLGKDVTNKALGGLPGMQKEGVDGIITSAVFTLYDVPKFTRVICLELFGPSMLPASILIGKIVDLRNTIRENGDYAKLSALEEFNIKYVQCINYQRKSTKHEGDPCSVILIQVDGDDEKLLEKTVSQIVALAADDKDIAIIPAKDKKEGEHFWEDRHKLSAIAKRTSGFKINEDVVLPLSTIPEFAQFLDQLNKELAASAYRYALQAIGRLPAFPFEDKDFNKEFSLASKVVQGEENLENLSDEEYMKLCDEFLTSLKAKYPELEKDIIPIQEYMHASRVIVASHMHAGDGNCHVNIPVNSNDPHMMHEAEEVAMRVMEMAQSLDGEVSGEHGIGITKINFLADDKMQALKEFKAHVDPREIMNPAKLVQRELPVKPFTFSFNRLIEDIKESGLADKEKLIHLLQNIQVCTRCGKCKLVCSMVYPERSYHYHPRNKNMVLGAMIEALYYSQITQGKPNRVLLDELRQLVEHCTGCGRCSVVCPVKIASSEVAMTLRAFLEEENAGGHPIKMPVLDYLSKHPNLVPKAARMAGMGQQTINKVVNVVPPRWREKFESPLFTHKGPVTGLSNLYDALSLQKGGIFLPSETRKNSEGKIEAIFYFAGCGGALFSRDIPLAAIALLLKAGYAVVMPENHICCGYPLLTSGADNQYKENMIRNELIIKQCLDKAMNKDLEVLSVISACGSCRDSLSEYKIEFNNKALPYNDCIQFLADKLESGSSMKDEEFVYHGSCHAEWSNVKPAQSAPMVIKTLNNLTQAKITQNLGCCGESGMGAISSPKVYNALRARKAQKLGAMIANFNPKNPIIVGCPSCLIGIRRSLITLKDKRKVIHSVEWLANQILQEKWKNSLKSQASSFSKDGLRTIDINKICKEIKEEV